MFDRAILEVWTPGSALGHRGHLGSGEPSCPRTDLAEVARSGSSLTENDSRPPTFRDQPRFATPIVGAAQLYPEDERQTLEGIHNERPPPDVRCQEIAPLSQRLPLIADSGGLFRLDRGIAQRTYHHLLIA